jgi:hypothetical protein
MRSRFVYPHTTTLTLGNGDRLIVRQRLNVGEQRESYRACSTVVTTEDGGVRTVPNPLLIGVAKVAAYLVDWSLEDGDAPPIRGLDLVQRIAVLDNLDPEDFFEFKTAIDAHEGEQTAARLAEKNGRSGERNAPVISPSPFVPAGASSGSVS